MENNAQYISIQNDDKVTLQEKKRSGILYYSISQVAALLGESDSKIRYYTNIFDNLLKIQVSNKELIYTDKDIDKLEFLIRLKNKGLTIKEIQSYCEELPLDDNDISNNISKETNTLSISDLISLISESQINEISKLKSELFDYIDQMKEDLASDMKDYICTAISEHTKNSEILTDDIFSKVQDLITDKFEYESSRMGENLATLSKNIESKSIELNDELIYRIKKFENVVERAYTIEHEIASQKSPSFLARLFGAH